MTRSGRHLVVAAILAVAAVLAVPPAAADHPADFPVADGRFFTQTGSGDGSGYAVTDSDGIEFWSFFRAAGGVAELGYPVSARWTDGPFTLQAFQKAILQWLDGRGVAYLNIYDRLNAAGLDEWLDVTKNVPRHRTLPEDDDQPFDVIRANHLAILDANPAIRSRWFENANWLNAYGLPLAYEEREGLRVLRAQRAVFQQWMIPTAFAEIGGVVIANGGDHYKSAGLIPEQATLPLASTATHPVAGSSAVVPTDLALPIDLDDLRFEYQLLSPFGLYRHSKDSPPGADITQFGHGGIDLPLTAEAPIYALASGVIISDTPTTDFRPGRVVVVQITEGDRPGEGWILLYEHINLEPGLGVGSRVLKGRRIGRNAMAAGQSNNHVELAYAFNGLQFTRLKTCWVDQLAPADRAALTTRFNGTIRTSDPFVTSWRTAVDEGMYPYGALLDPVRFPDGAQLCYPMGTDVREPIEEPAGEATDDEQPNPSAGSSEPAAPHP